MASRTARKYAPGDLVRFPDGKVDWEIAKVRGDRLHPSVQHLTLRSGMSSRVLQTSNHRVIPRDEALAREESK